ncbi:septal ring lytic transglycosylase RlpA family protein [Desulfatitalea alkaliphila]|uniref:Probable endolytic peptidoglycan transglycosylase RlpA n=1 Tax=Desulfatitalea alkaliphila TaxID=2929485 RepID=A0AA41R565_9BACT|nr:septal ring lytic transglycosylase RlpA family protein [Desulfatitalea alkaliphila]MCJ8500996.1 septal ring lytic transglycosylase RlpA family protein [Desulfatitalea alkaliphila]
MKAFDGLKCGLLLVLLGFVVQACSVLPPPAPAPVPTEPGKPRPYRVFGVWYHPMADARGYEEEGVASWYGEDFHGLKTSSGEIYDMHAMTAAHKTLPLGTFVRVQNLTNNRTVDLRINDRGPFAKGRIIDLSYAAAKALDVVRPGTAPVRVVALGVPLDGQRVAQTQEYMPLDYYHGNFTFQVGAFSERANAERYVATLSQTYDNVHMSPFHDGERTFYRVRLGLKTDLEEAEAFEAHLKANGFPGAIIVAE